MMMKRKFFFWLEKLKITPAERKTVSGLLIVLSALTIANLVIAPPEPFDGNQYAALEEQFRERTARLAAEREKRMQRYFPPAGAELRLTAAADTARRDTTSEGAADSTGQAAQKPHDELVNVNKAGSDRLQILPGIGPAYAKRIIRYREKHGEFNTEDELKKIKGIGEKRLEKLIPFIKLKASP
ncbi:ComEA family DNA-binding protein [Fodinibius sp.]|uniref:ComEA family DNA-binding protein n=1 Tax=Fodinibius sp. TaxID=1872440 RepID=UPI00356980A8